MIFQSLSQAHFPFKEFQYKKEAIHEKWTVENID